MGSKRFVNCAKIESKYYFDVMSMVTSFCRFPVINYVIICHFAFMFSYYIKTYLFSYEMSNFSQLFLM